MGPREMTAYEVDVRADNPLPGSQTNLTPSQLAEIVSAFASSSDDWIERVQMRVRHRWYERVYHGTDHDIWIISWLPGQSTGFHDHGSSAGAFVVATGFLEEHCPGEAAQIICAGQTRTFGPDYAHDVRNASLAPAVSIHAYSPPLNEMNQFVFDDGRLVPRKEAEQDKVNAQSWSIETNRPVWRQDVRSIDQVLAAARARLHRLSARSAYEASEQGAVLVDIRPAAQRAQEGGIPGAHVVERNVLEWRLDPTSSARLSIATSHDVQVIVLCSKGYTSSLAAESLQNLGLWRATDIVDGFQAWLAAGLPVMRTTS